MIRIERVISAAKRHRWAAAAAVTIATLLARDAAVQDTFAKVAARARQALGSRDESGREPAETGYVRYAAMLNCRDQLERARKEYNEGEGALKGDRLLEAQDRLREAKARDRQARLAFLPELARRCELANVPLPREAAEAVDALRAETND